MARLSPENRTRAEAIVACYPKRRSALIPLCHLAQAQDGFLTEEAMEDIAGLRLYAGRGAGHGELLRHAAHRAGGPPCRHRLHEHRLHVGRRL